MSIFYILSGFICVCDSELMCNIDIMSSIKLCLYYFASIEYVRVIYMSLVSLLS